MDTNRRAFLKKALLAVLSLLGLIYLVPALRVLAPAKTREKEIVYVPLLEEADVPRSGVRKTELSFIAGGRERKSRVFITAMADDVIVFSAVCSHLGCLVNYHRKRREFVCPCHGGRYDLTGKNIAGPPPAPLTRLPVKLEKGMIMVGIKV